MFPKLPTHCRQKKGALIHIVNIANSKQVIFINPFAPKSKWVWRNWPTPSLRNAVKRLSSSFESIILFRQLKLTATKHWLTWPASYQRPRYFSWFEIGFFFLDPSNFLLVHLLTLVTKLPESESYETTKMTNPLVRNFVKVVNKRLLDLTWWRRCNFCRRTKIGDRL